MSNADSQPPFSRRVNWHTFFDRYLTNYEPNFRAILFACGGKQEDLQDLLVKLLSISKNNRDLALTENIDEINAIATYVGVCLKNQIKKRQDLELKRQIIAQKGFGYLNRLNEPDNDDFTDLEILMDIERELEQSRRYGDFIFLIEYITTYDKTRKEISKFARLVKRLKSVLRYLFLAILPNFIAFF